MKALVIEDADVMGERIAQALEKLGVETVWIRFLSEAEEKIRAGGYDVVVLDACFGTTSEPNTTHLIPMIRVTGFTGPIIANSNSHNDFLIRAGCTHRNDGLKPQLQEVLRQAGIIK